MRILVVNYECPPLGGGGGRAALALAAQWAQSHTVDYLTSRDPTLPAREQRRGVTLHRVPVLGRTSRHVASLPSLLSFPPAAVPRGFRLMSRHDYDVVNTHFAVPSGPLGALLSFCFGVPNVLSLHGGDLYKPTRWWSPHRWLLLRRSVRHALNGAASVVAQSRDTARRARTLFDHRGPVNVIPLPFEPPSFEPASRRELGLSPKAFYLVTVGRLIPRKRIDRIIDALPNLPRRVRLLVVGAGPLASTLEEHARRAGVDDRVTLTGHVDEERKYRLLSAGDLFVLTSEHEGFGIVLQEAMSQGLPILATSTGGQTDLVEHDRHGRLIDDPSPEGLAGAVRTMMQHPERLSAVGKRNRKAIRRYRPERIAREYLKRFRRLSRGSG